MVCILSNKCCARIFFSFACHLLHISWCCLKLLFAIDNESETQVHISRRENNVRSASDGCTTAITHTKTIPLVLLQFCNQCGSNLAFAHFSQMFISFYCIFLWYLLVDCLLFVLFLSLFLFASAHCSVIFTTANSTISPMRERVRQRHSVKEYQRFMWFVAILRTSDSVFLPLSLFLIACRFHWLCTRSIDRSGWQLFLTWHWHTASQMC